MHPEGRDNKQTCFEHRQPATFANENYYVSAMKKKRAEKNVEARKRVKNTERRVYKRQAASAKNCKNSRIVGITGVE
jgi:hypothetical protein